MKVKSVPQLFLKRVWFTVMPFRVSPTRDRPKRESRCDLSKPAFHLNVLVTSFSFVLTITPIPIELTTTFEWSINYYDSA